MLTNHQLLESFQIADGVEACRMHYLGGALCGAARGTVAVFKGDLRVVVMRDLSTKRAKEVFRKTCENLPNCVDSQTDIGYIRIAFRKAV